MPVNFNTPLDGKPNTVYTTTLDEVPYAFDFTAMLLTGEVVANPVGRLYDMTLNGQLVTLTDPATVQAASTTTCIQIIDGAILTGGHTYRCVVSADITGIVLDKTLSISVVIVCSF